MKIAIIGGGMAGLGAAYELVKKDRGVDVHIFEKSRELGGLAHAIKLRDTYLEIFYHHMFPNYGDLFDIAEEIGIKDKIFFRRAKTGVFYGGKIHPMDTPLDLIKFNPLTLKERLQAALSLTKLRLKRSHKEFENITAVAWLKKHFGEHAYSILWKPLLASKFGENFENIGMSWFWGRIYERPTKFGYFHGGFKTLTDALQKHLQSKNATIRLENRVEKIEKKNNGFIVKTQDQEEFFDYVIVAAPPASFTKMGESVLPRDFVAQLVNLKYFGTICGILVLKNHFSDYYWLNINERNYPFVGLVEQTRFVPEKTYGGYHPIYMPRYLNPENEFYKLNDDDIWSRFIPLLRTINPHFEENWIIERHLFRAPFTQPIMGIHYDKILPKYKTPIRNLWWVSMSHVYPWDRSTEHSFHAGKELARELLATL